MDKPICIVTIETTILNNTNVGILLPMDKPICIVTIETMNLSHSISILLHMDLPIYIWLSQKQRI